MTNPTYIALDAKEVELQIDWLLMEYADLADDEALKADMIEGSTDLHSVLARIIDHRAEALEMVTGIEERAAHLTERKERYKRRAGAMTALAHRLMIVAGQSKVALPEATVSVMKGRASVIIDDEDAVPRQLGTSSWKPDKTAIKAQIDAGEAVPGAHIEIGNDSLTVRTK